MGKYSLILILGFSIVVLGLIPLIHGRASRSYENYIDYYESSQARNIAISGANFAANMLFQNSSASISYSNIQMGEGSFSISTTIQPDSTILLTSSGKFHRKNHTVEVLFGPSSFAKFGVYLATMGSIYWTTGDTVRGPSHVENILNVYGTPVFFGKVTTLNGTNPSILPNGPTNPKFYGGYQSGISVSMPPNLNNLQMAASSGGKIFTPPASPIGTYELYFKFNSNGTVSYKEYKGSIQLFDTTVGINQLAPNGVILVSGGNIKVEGTVNGKVTLCATSGSVSGTGKIYIKGNILYNDNPIDNPSSDDFLGLVAEKDVVIPLPDGFPGTTCPTNIDIYACVFSRTGKFYAELDYKMGKLGNVNFYGSMSSYTIGAFSAGSPSYGYSNNFHFDRRLLIETPPYYPKTNILEILSWKE